MTLGRAGGSPGRHASREVVPAPLAAVAAVRTTPPPGACRQAVTDEWGAQPNRSSSVHAITGRSG